ncbi:MAG: ComEC/Rec2 family competence protein [Planctomycetes bacterium]|nr:ComEC/Rec2 family competence protein [Planctomycetota bacterium]
MRPLVWFVPPFAAGTALGAEMPVAGAAALAGAALALFILSRRNILAGAALGLCAGLLRVALAPLPEPVTEGPTVLRGRVVGPSHLTPAGRSALADTGARHDAPARCVFTVESRECGRIRVQTSEPLEPLLGGEEVALSGRLRNPRPPSNPGQFDRRAWLRRQGIAGTMYAHEIEVLSGPRGPLSLLSRVRRFLRGRLDAASRPEAAALAAAMLFGDREGLDERLTLDLQRTGTTHVLAVSGFNVALVVLAVWALLVLAGVRGRLRVVLLLAATWIYALTAGLEASVLRAAIMASVWLGAEIFRRRSDPPVSLAAAALVILAFDPHQVRDVGFQLSFLAVIGILALVPLLSRSFGPQRPWIHRVYGAALVSLAAWLATAPVVQTEFHLLTPCVLVTNLLFSPLVLAITALGAVSIAVPPAGLLTGVVYDVLAWLARAITSVPGSYFFVPGLPPALAALYYGGGTAWAAWTRAAPAGWKILLVPVLVAPLAAPGLLHRRPEDLRLAALDVGRGACLYVEFADGRNFLFDAGSLDFRDAGASVAAPYLWSRGVFRVDTLFLSHPDADHANGALSLVERFRVRRIVVGRPFAREPAGAELLRRARERGVEVVEVERVGAPVRIAPDIELFGPPVWEKYGRAVPSNESSLVLRVGGRILLTGDIEETGVEALLENPDVAAAVLVVPHHGKSDRRNAELLGRVRPDLAVIPGAEHTASPRTLRELRERCATYAVGTTGALEIDVTNAGVRVLR